MIEPLSLEQARALVQLCGVPNTGYVRAEQHAALHQVYATMSPIQRSMFIATMDHAWPRPQRSTRNRPVCVSGFPTQIKNWEDAWAVSIHRASQEQR
jgi:hypothetical protein